MAVISSTFRDIGGDESAMALAGVLDHPDASLRAEAVDALREIGEDAAALILRRAPADEQAPIREAAAEYLAELSRHKPF